MTQREAIASQPQPTATYWAAFGICLFMGLITLAPPREPSDAEVAVGVLLCAAQAGSRLFLPIQAAEFTARLRRNDTVYRLFFGAMQTLGAVGFVNLFMGHSSGRHEEFRNIGTTMMALSFALADLVGWEAPFRQRIRRSQIDPLSH